VRHRLIPSKCAKYIWVAEKCRVGKEAVDNSWSRSLKFLQQLVLPIVVVFYWLWRQSWFWEQSMY